MSFFLASSQASFDLENLTSTSFAGSDEKYRYFPLLSLTKKKFMNAAYSITLYPESGRRSRSVACVSEQPQA